MLRTIFLFWLAVAAYRPPGQTPGETPRANPFPYTRRSIALGRQIYLKYCVRCHDPKGKPIIPADPGATHPADLTQPKNWVHGTSDREMFDTLREGTEEMPGFADKLRDDEIWRVVHFVRRLWPEELRPKLQRDR